MFLNIFLGAAAFLMMATLFKSPVSTTHSIVGATVGYSLVLHGVNGINGTKLIEIGNSAKIYENKNLFKPVFSCFLVHFPNNGWNFGCNLLCNC